MKTSYDLPASFLPDFIFHRALPNDVRTSLRFLSLLNFWDVLFLGVSCIGHGNTKSLPTILGPLNDLILQIHDPFAGVSLLLKILFPHARSRLYLHLILKTNVISRIDQK